MTISGSLSSVNAASARIGRAYGLPARPDAAGATRTTPAAQPQVAAAGAEATGGAPSLRDVLTDEERAYFDQIAMLGPITYGPGRRTGMAPEAPRGLRLDVTA